MITSTFCSVIGQPKLISNNQKLLIDLALGLGVTGLALSIIFGGYAPMAAGYATIGVAALLAAINLGRGIVRCWPSHSPAPSSQPRLSPKEIDNVQKKPTLLFDTGEEGIFKRSNLLEFSQLFKEHNSPVLVGSVGQGEEERGRFIALCGEITSPQITDGENCIVIVYKDHESDTDIQTCVVYSSHSTQPATVCAKMPSDFLYNIGGKIQMVNDSQKPISNCFFKVKPLSSQFNEAAAAELKTT